MSTFGAALLVVFVTGSAYLIFESGTQTPPVAAAASDAERADSTAILIGPTFPHGALTVGRGGSKGFVVGRLILREGAGGWTVDANMPLRGAQG